MRSEYEHALELANKALDTPWRDSDDDLAVLARQFLRVVERGEKDKARLDWLDEVNRSMNEHYGSEYGWKYDINHNRAAMLSDHHWPRRTIREAIDEAVAARMVKGK